MKKDRKQNKTIGKTQISLKNGIAFQPVIGMSLRSPVLSFFPFVQLAIAMISSLSVIYMLPAFLNSSNGSCSGSYEISNGTTVFMVIAFTAIASLLSTSKELFVKLIGVAYMGLNAVYIVTHMNSVVNGFMYTVNTYSKCASFAKPLFAQIAANASTGEVEMFLLAFAFIITLLTSFGCIYRISFPIEFIASFPLFELMTFWGMRFDEDYTWTIIGMLFSWITVLSFSLINHSTKCRNSSNTFAVHRRKKTYYLTSEKIKHSFFGLMCYAVVIVSLSVFIVTIAYIHSADDVRNRKINKLRYDISTGFKNFSRDVTEQASLKSKPIPGRGQKMVGGTNGGRLGLYDELSFYGKTAMRVTVPKFYRPIYLRGYAGEKYQDNSWLPVKNDEDAAVAFSDRYGAYVLDYDFIHTYYNTIPGTGRIDIKIDPLNCSEDVIYAPYGSYYSQIELAGEQVYDGMLSPKKKMEGEDYNIVMLPVADDDLDWQEVIAMQQSHIAAADSPEAGLAEYDSKVIHSNSVFSYVPEEAAGSVDRVIAEAGLDSSNIYDINYIHNAVMKYFEDNGYTYDLKPGVTPEDKDFVSYFLDVQKKGYCTYYASTGVMIMRRMGYAARFVEGYVIEPSEYTDDKTPIIVTDRSAHAWCEVFIDGCGWYPLEFTPGYKSDNPNLTDTDKNITKPTLPDLTISTPEHSSNSGSSSSEPGASGSSTAAGANTSSGGAGLSGGDSSTAEGAAVTDISSSSKKPSDRTPEDAGYGHEIDLRQYAYTLLTIGFIAAVVVTAATRRKNKLDHEYKQCHCTENKISVINCYVSVIKYAKLVGLQNDGNLTDVQLTSKMLDLMNEKMPDLCVPFIELSDAALLAYMSDSEISDEISARGRNTYNDLRNRVFELMNPLQKLRAMWILGLY